MWKARFENIKQTLRRNEFVTIHITFRLDMEDHDAVLAEIQNELGTCTTPNP